MAAGISRIVIAHNKSMKPTLARPACSGARKGKSGRYVASDCRAA